MARPYVYSLVRKAVKAGQLVRPLTCEKCGNIRATWAHHDDYMKPLEVRWLCKPCHIRWHVENGPGLNVERADLPAAKRHNLTDQEREDKKLTKDRRYDEMADLISDGWTLQAVGDKFGVSRERVRQIVGKAGKHKTKIDAFAQYRDEMNRLRVGGKSLIEIANLYGTSLHVVQGLNLDKPPFPHGELRGYRRGCRCTECRHSNVLHTKATMKSLRAQGRCIVCGKDAGGKQKCRECRVKWYIKWGPTGKAPGESGVRVGTSGIAGISWKNSTSSWRVVKTVNGKQRFFGEFKNLEEAKELNAKIRSEYGKESQNGAAASRGAEATN